MKELLIYYLKLFPKIEKNYFCGLHGEGSNRRTSSGHRNDFQSHFSRSFFWKKSFLDIFWRSFRGLKTYSEKKDLWVRTFKLTLRGKFPHKYDQMFRTHVHGKLSNNINIIRLFTLKGPKRPSMEILEISLNQNSVILKCRPVFEDHQNKNRRYCPN